MCEIAAFGDFHHFHRGGPRVGLQVRIRIMARRSARKVVYFAALILLLGALIPVPQVVAPDWTVTTLDRAHSPLAGVTVREVWEQYSVESASHEEDRKTDAKGEVHFPRRTRKISVAGKLVGCAFGVLSAGAHASCGAHSYLVAFGPGIDTLDWEDLGQEDGTSMPWQHSTLVLKR